MCIQIFDVLLLRFCSQFALAISGFKSQSARHTVTFLILQHQKPLIGPSTPRLRCHCCCTPMCRTSAVIGAAKLKFKFPVFAWSECRYTDVHTCVVRHKSIGALADRWIVIVCKNILPKNHMCSFLFPSTHQLLSHMIISVIKRCTQECGTTICMLHFLLQLNFLAKYAYLLWVLSFWS